MGVIKIYFNSRFINSMNKTHIDNLSAIIEKKSFEESQQTLEESKPIPNIRCPQNNRENYHCMICNRLRNVCPYSKPTPCLHEGRERRVYKSDYFMEKSNISTMPGDRLRTFSNQEVFKQTEQSRSRQQSFNKINEFKPSIPQQRTQINITPADEVIYYPVIHNRYIVSPALEKSRNMGTPNREKKSRRMDYDEQVILTPTQIKEMLYYNKQ